MADQPRIDPQKLNQYDKLLKELWKLTDQISSFFKEMSNQEKVLAGGLILQVQSPWRDSRMSILIGGLDMVMTLINQAMREIKRPPPPEKPSVFADKDKLN